MKAVLRRKIMLSQKSVITKKKIFSRKSAEEGAGGKSFGAKGEGFSVRKRSQDEKGISRERGRWHRHD